MYRKYFFLISRVLFFVIFSCTFIANTFAQTLQRYEYAQAKMGTEFRVIFYCQSDSLANVIQDAVYKKVDELNLIFSDYEQASELNGIVKFEARDTTVKLSDTLYDVFVTAQLVSQETDGAFDITIGPLSKLWRRSIRHNEFPEQEEIKEAKNLVSYKNIKLMEHNKVQLLQQGMKLDLGGIAKGATVDIVFDLVNSYGLTQVLVDGGGDIRVGASPPESNGWEIQLSNSKINVQNTALATSGDTYKYIINGGQRYSHIIDPRTGYGVKNAQNVMVQAESCMIADAIASAASVLKKDEAAKLWTKFDVKIIYDP